MRHRPDVARVLPLKEAALRIKRQHEENLRQLEEAKERARAAGDAGRRARTVTFTPEMWAEVLVVAANRGLPPDRALSEAVTFWKVISSVLKQGQELRITVDGVSYTISGLPAPEERPVTAEGE